MKIVYHPRYREVYTTDPAARAGRMESIVAVLEPGFEFVLPEPASVADITLIHTDWHIADVQRSPVTYELALLAAGGAIRAAELALSGEPAFALIRPPGHHASPDDCWGFCYFNNMAVSIARLLQEGRVASAAILDIDLHYGDGTENAFRNEPRVSYFHPEVSDREGFLDSISRFLGTQQVDLVAVSAGFDRHLEDWGRQLSTEDYRSIGRLVREFAEANCCARRYAVLEGGYNHEVLGNNVRAFVEG
jgi:acetoin utilization deacetylase AcuC-like enzyme